jgi:hypothetical protein
MRLDARLTPDGVELSIGMIRLQLSRREMRELMSIADGFRLELYPPKPEPTEWCWCEVGGDRAHGPFATREEALDDATEMSDEPRLIELGRVEYFDPTDYANDDADEEANRILEAMYDNCRSDFLEVDFIHSCDEACRDLKTAMWVWTKKHVTACGFWAMCDVERVLVWHDPELKLMYRTVMGEPVSDGSDHDWYYESVSDVKCSCGAELWGVDWWDGWINHDRHDVDCEECGLEWKVEVEYPEPVVVGLELLGGGNG